MEVRKEEKAELSTDVKGTLEKARKSVLATTSALAGPRGTLRVAKSPSARLARREEPAEPPVVPAVMPVCDKKEVSDAIETLQRREKTYSDLLDVDGEREGKLELGYRIIGREARRPWLILGEEEGQRVDGDAVDDLEILSGR